MSQTFPLKYPFTCDGTEYKELTLRRPKQRDLELMETRKGGDIAKSSALLADLAQVAPKVIQELDVEDSAEISAWLDGVFDPKGLRSRTDGG